MVDGGQQPIALITSQCSISLPTSSPYIAIRFEYLSILKWWSHHFNPLSYCEVTPPPPPLRRTPRLLLLTILAEFNILILAFLNPEFKIRQNYLREYSAFDKKKRNPGLKFNPELALTRRSNNPSTYLPTPSRLLPSPCPPLGPPSGRCTDSRFPYPFQGLFSSLPSPQPSQMEAGLFSSFFFLFTLPPPIPPPSTYLPTPLYLPIYLAVHLTIYLPPTYQSTYLPNTLPSTPLSLPSPRPASWPTSASHTLPKAFFPPSPRPKPSQMKAVLFSIFFFFMLIRRDSNPSLFCLPLCLPISCLFNAYANCAIPAR